MTVQSTWFTFADLDGRALYEILRIRQQVFILEQASFYPDIDGNDPAALHLVARDDAGNLIGCLRLLPPGKTHACPAIGRLAIDKPFRGRMLGHRLMEEGIRKARALYPGDAIYISAQHHLKPFYTQFGFAPRGRPYDEDGILHIDMLCPAPNRERP